jgi:hypothetical protein
LLRRKLVRGSDRRLGKIALKSSFIVNKNYYTDEVKYNEIGETCNTHGREESMSIISVLNPEGINFL